MVKQKKSGLLSGLWTFLEVNASPDLDQMSERKRKCFVIEEVQRMFDGDQAINLETIKLAGQVTTIIRSSFESFSRSFQCRHLFSHIDQQYIVYAARCDQDDLTLGTAQIRWCNEEQVQTSAISTAMKKVRLILFSRDDSSLYSSPGVQYCLAGDEIKNNQR